MSSATRRVVVPSRRARAKAALPAVVDSSGWLEYLADSDRADLFEPALVATDGLIVPVLVIYEVVKKLRREARDSLVSRALQSMQQGLVVPVDLPLALSAAINGLPLADSLIYATAQAHGAELWTQDSHFEGLPGVRFFPKQA